MYLARRGSRKSFTVGSCQKLAINTLATKATINYDNMFATFCDAIKMAENQKPKNNAGSENKLQ